MLVTIAIILLMLAVSVGVFILKAVLKNQATPKPFVFLHGPLAITAIVLLIVNIYKGHTEGLLFASVVILIGAALGGLTMFTMDMCNKRFPKSLAIIHPIAGITGLIVLIIYAFQ